jgi:polar amino acid transport system permease protein
LPRAPSDSGQGDAGGSLRAGILFASAVGLWLLLQTLLDSKGIDAGELVAAAPLLLHGLGITIYVSVVSVLLGAILGAALVAGLLSTAPAVRKLVQCWCLAFRGTPAIAQLFLVYYGAGEIHRLLGDAHLWWFFRDPLRCVLFTFTLNSAAYQARIVHGALLSLPREQTDAALSLALPRRVALVRVLLPQALLTALRPLGNEITKMTKASAIASLVTVLDLLGTAKYLVSQSLDFGFYILAAVL